MPGFNPENINIHDLTIEEPEQQEVFFNPEKDITEKDRDNFQKVIRIEIRGKHPSFIQAAEHISQMLTLGIEPNLSEEDYFAGLGKQELQKVHDDLVDTFKNGNVVNLPGDGGAAFIILANSIGRLLGAKDIAHTNPELMQEKLMESRQSMSYFLSYAAKVKEAGCEPTISENDKKGINEAIAEGKGWLYDAKLAYSYAGLLADAKILGLPMKVSTEDWEIFRQNIRYFKQQKEVNVSKISPDENSENLLQLYYYLGILAADELQIEKGGGLKLINKKPDLTSDSPDMPESRKF